MCLQLIWDKLTCENRLAEPAACMQAAVSAFSCSLYHEDLDKAKNYLRLLGVKQIGGRFECRCRMARRG